MLKQERDSAPEVEAAQFTEATARFADLMRDAVASGMERDMEFTSAPEACERPMIVPPPLPGIDNGPERPRAKLSGYARAHRERSGFRDRLIARSTLRARPQLGHFEIIDLTDLVCHWPQGEAPRVFFCGAPKAETVPYCHDHCFIAYRSPRALTRAELRGRS